MRYDTVESFEQFGDLSFASVEPLWNNQSIRRIGLTKALRTAKSNPSR